MSILFILSKEYGEARLAFRTTGSQSETMKTTLTVDESGTIVLPETLRKAFGVEEMTGDRATLNRQRTTDA